MVKVTVIIPSTMDRKEMNERIMGIYDSQDYPNKQLRFETGDGTVGAKRNRLCQDSDGDIILHMDSDDLYSEDWISRSVEALISSGADIVGLSTAYFYDIHRQHLYRYTSPANAQMFLCGATLCYTRKAWKRKPFLDISEGEDMHFISNNGRLHAHNHNVEMFTALWHGSNTCGHRAVNTREMKGLPLSEAPAMLRQWVGI